MSNRSLIVALVGNPNTGKSTLFNALTGLRQHVGNYPGVTVELKKGTAQAGDVVLHYIDLPGTYSLAARSPDEMVTVDLSSAISRKNLGRKLSSRLSMPATSIDISI